MAQKVRADEMQLLTTRWALLYKQEKAIEEEKAQLSTRIKELLAERGVGEFAVSPSEAIILLRSTRKVPAKKDIIAAFGTKAGEEFWDRLEPKVSEYLSLRIANAPPTGNGV